MLRGVVVFLILAAIAAFVGYRFYSQEKALRAAQERHIVHLQDQIQKLKDSNATLQDQIAKVQDENNNLKSYNDILTKALAQAKLTGKVPEIMPYPPK